MARIVFLAAVALCVALVRPFSCPAQPPRPPEAVAAIEQALVEAIARAGR